MLDLQQFCSTDATRPYLMRPFSRYGFTWATDGSILVRVVLRPKVPDTDERFDVRRPLGSIDTAVFFRPSFELPLVADKAKCESCYGTGKEHSCPSCECECGDCSGKGVIDIECSTSTSIGPKEFSLHYVRLMLSLPGIELSAWSAQPDQSDRAPLLFKFEGGVGALMPLTGERPMHVDIKLSAAT